MTNASAVLCTAPVVNGTVGAYSPVPNASGTGNAFVYQKRQYQFDLDTRALAGGVRRLRTLVNGAIMNGVNITLQKQEACSKAHV